jgi:hypothetical protein
MRARGSHAHPDDTATMAGRDARYHWPGVRQETWRSHSVITCTVEQPRQVDVEYARTFAFGIPLKHEVFEGVVC